MRRSAVPIVLFMLILTTYGGGLAVAASSASAHDSLKFTRLSVKDPGINNIEAVSFLIPAGWKVEGGIKWFPSTASWPTCSCGSATRRPAPRSSSFPSRTSPG